MPSVLVHLDGTPALAFATHLAVDISFSTSTSTPFELPISRGKSDSSVQPFFADIGIDHAGTTYLVEILLGQGVCGQTGCSAYRAAWRGTGQDLLEGRDE